MLKYFTMTPDQIVACTNEKLIFFQKSNAPTFSLGNMNGEAQYGKPVHIEDFSQKTEMEKVVINYLLFRVRKKGKNLLTILGKTYNISPDQLLELKTGFTQSYFDSQIQLIGADGLTSEIEISKLFGNTSSFEPQSRLWIYILIAVILLFLILLFVKKFKDTRVEKSDKGSVDFYTIGGSRVERNESENEGNEGKRNSFYDTEDEDIAAKYGKNFYKDLGQEFFDAGFDGTYYDDANKGKTGEGKVGD